MSQPIHFVHEKKPGSSLDSNQVRALRSHVRKVNLERSNQKSTRRLENFRSLTITDFSEGGKVKSGKRKQPPNVDACPSLEPEIENLPSREGASQRCPLNPGDANIPTTAFQFLSSSDGDGPPRRCSCGRAKPPNPKLPNPGQLSIAGASSCKDGCHPYASQISKAIDLDETRIDYLLRSCAFQVAAEPLLVSGPVDGDLTTLSLFPECLTNSAFLYALLYSILHIHNSCNTTNESLLLKTKAIECLREDLQKDDPNIRALSIGTILLLSCVAHHCGDLAESSAHSEGLYKLLEHCHADGTQLRSEILHAVFWQHLLGTALVCGQHHFQPPDFRGLLGRSEDFPISSLPALPLGFALHEEVISNDVLLCIRNVLYLQELATAGTTDQNKMEDLQISIQSRLVFDEESCKKLGPLAECCRLAVYIVCYMTSTPTWRSAFVPLRLAERLLAYLDKSFATDLWRYRRDLFLWLLLVGMSVGRGRNCFAVELASRYQEFVDKVIEDVSNWDELKDGHKALHNVVRRFIYARDWVAKRHQISRWTDLEMGVFLCGSDDVDIDMGNEDTDALLKELVPDANLFE
ncbi:uncharacterized protein Z519_09929 [Cladophialophora bantiana CBS 173.52]|uniref:Transcription factor domain-containing protein n=1 Tax=Cladophialophora bantiana (strain ATCC 10958 / CBS 173.52 / CDC B-1940 / NIH 8579) TaxID=1442370 RepID=A0A0D2FT87_CLAB1|nr:uncharacterized protein Z519_09929 [Cladophialophora bantiana CBS 173.52]KIW89772.1 hypothetical protein Z519_09929 [Cladophialophora bantiana CBS 173.52]